MRRKFCIFVFANVFLLLNLIESSNVMAKSDIEVSKFQTNECPNSTEEVLLVIDDLAKVLDYIQRINDGNEAVEALVNAKKMHINSLIFDFKQRMNEILQEVQDAKENKNSNTSLLSTLKKEFNALKEQIRWKMIERQVWEMVLSDEKRSQIEQSMQAKSMFFKRCIRN
jgi:uncharacterized tellurite resistance protein B-like protein